MTKGLKMNRSLVISGRAWAVRDQTSKLIDDIDTDQIFHNRHLAITDIWQMGQFAFGNLKGWEDFPRKAAPGDILVVGKNFGAGSSRQQAVDCFISLGISLIIGESFGSIYSRNAVNSGLAIMRCLGLSETGPGSKQFISSGDRLEADLQQGTVFRLDGEKILIPGAVSLSRVEMEIYLAGGLFEFGASLFM